MVHWWRAGGGGGRPPDEAVHGHGHPAAGVAGLHGC